MKSLKNIFKLALTLQKFLADDPVDGDLKMQEYLHPVVTTAALIWGYGPKATKPIDIGNPDNGFTNVRFLQKYKNKMMSFVDIHKEEWDVSTDRTYCCFPSMLELRHALLFSLNGFSVLELY